MKRKALPTFVVLITLIGLAAGADSARAQARRKITLEASVPFEFVVGNRSFPAGRYVFEMATGLPKTTERSGVLVVRNHERSLYAAVATDVTADARVRSAHKLEFVRSGGRVLLAKVWRQGNAAGLSLRTGPGATDSQEWEQSQVLTLDAMEVNETM